MLRNKNDFERYVPSKHRQSSGATVNVVRTAFIQSKADHTPGSKLSCKLRIYVGKEIARKFQWQDGDRIAVEVSVSDPRVMRLIKTSQTDYQSYKLATQQKNQQYYTIVLTWSKFIPEKKDCFMRVVQHTPDEGGIIIFLH